MTDSEIFRDKKYQNDKIFNAIQSRHLTLNDDDIKRNNQNLQKVYMILLFTILINYYFYIFNYQKSINYLTMLVEATQSIH